MALFCALLLALGLAHAQESEGAVCPDLAAPPDDLQVAWVSPVRRRVRAHSALAVVRVADLRALIRAQGPDPTRTLQTLGLRGPHAEVRRRWKVTIFDVEVGQLCRPVEDVPEGEDADGLPACGGGRATGARRVTGCGQTLDRATGLPGLDQFQITWREASRQGFCVMPLERFLGGA
jgi:hypothetical protein